VFVYTPKRNILSILQLQLFPVAFPVGIPDSLDALVSEEILAMDTGFCHSGLSVVEESHDMDLFRNHAKLQDEIHLSMTLVEELTRVMITLPELGRSSILVDSNGTTLLSRECREVEEVAILHCRFTRGVVHWTCCPVLLDAHAHEDDGECE
jgi:hypothetical protein